MIVGKSAPCPHHTAHSCFCWACCSPLCLHCLLPRSVACGNFSMKVVIVSQGLPWPWSLSRATLSLIQAHSPICPRNPLHPSLGTFSFFFFPSCSPPPDPGRKVCTVFPWFHWRCFLATHCRGYPAPLWPHEQGRLSL